MKRLLLALSILSPSLLAMDKPKKVVGADKSTLYTTLQQYVDCRKLGLKLVDIFLTDENDKESSTSDSDESSTEEKKATERETQRLIVEAIIKSLKLKSFKVSLKQGQNKYKQVKLSKLCDTIKLRKVLVKMNDSYFDKEKPLSSYFADLVTCIKWEAVEKEFGGKQSKEYLKLKETAQLLTDYSNGKLKEGSSIAKCINIEKVAKAFFQIKLSEYMAIDGLIAVIDTILHHNVLPIDLLVDCCKTPLLNALYTFSDQKQTAMHQEQTLRTSLRGLLKFLSDFIEDEAQALYKMANVLALYGQYDDLEGQGLFKK